MEAYVFQVLLIGVRHAEDDFIQKLFAESDGLQFQFSRVSTYEDAIQLIQFKSWDAILVHQSIGSHPGLEFIHHVRLGNKHIPVFLWGDRYDNELAYQSRKVGASDYFAKEFLPSPVLNTILEAKHHRLLDNHQKTAFPRFLKIFTLFQGHFG